MAKQNMESPPATHVVIGAGDGAVEPAGTIRTLLVEPEPNQAADLARRHAGRDGVTVLPAAVSAGDGEAELLVFNFPALSSLHAPAAALTELMPGLRVVARPKVQVLSVGALLERLGEIERPLRLTLDAPGAERDILHGWKAADRLEAIDRLDLRCTENPMYEGAIGRAELQEWLEAEGFRLARGDDSDPSWPVLYFKPNPAHRKLAALRIRLAETEAQLAEGRTALEASRKDLRELTDKAEWRYKRIKELEAEAKDQAAVREAMSAELDAGRAGAAEAAEAAEALTARIAELETALEAEAAARTDAESTVAGHETRLAGLETALAEAGRAAEGEAAKLTEASDRAEARGKRIAELEAALAEGMTALEASRKDLRELTDKAEWRYKRIKDLEAEAKDQAERHKVLRADIEAARKDTQAAQGRIRDMEQKLGLARNDLRRAEGQIDLIKDLLLRGDAL